MNGLVVYSDIKSGPFLYRNVNQKVSKSAQNSIIEYLFCSGLSVNLQFKKKGLINGFGVFDLT